MADLFQLRTNENDGGNDEDDVKQVVLHGTFADLMKVKDNFDMVGYIIETDRYVWTAPGCCCFRSALSPPDDHEYTLEIIVTESESENKFQIAGMNSISVESTLQGLLSLLPGKDVTIKTFATNPRRIFPVLKSDDDTVGCLKKILLAFWGLDDVSTLQTLARRTPALELRQCATADNGEKIYSKALLDSTVLETLTISCTMPEFTKLANEWDEHTVESTTGSTKLKELHLKLHFWLQGPAVEAFWRALSKMNALERLTIEYLDLVDDSWMLFFQQVVSSSPSLKYLKLKFTDNFVDNYRRLTPERRLARTQAVLDALQTNHVIHEIIWPDFQKDESILPDIESCLERNRH